MTPQERIKADAREYCKDQALGSREDCSYCMPDYIAGATAEHERTEDEIDKAIHAERNKMQAKFNASDKQWAALLREQNVQAQVLVDALSDIASGKVLPQFIASMALEQWKSGKGKEVENG